MDCGGRRTRTAAAPSEEPSEISSRYVRASEPPLSRGGSVGGDQLKESVAAVPSHLRSKVLHVLTEVVFQTHHFKATSQKDCGNLGFSIFSSRNVAIWPLSIIRDLLRKICYHLVVGINHCGHVTAKTVLFARVSIQQQ